MSRDRATASLDAARRLAARGKFDAALKKHIWFHNNALKIRRSYYGVRLSFALGDWLKLAQRYRPALSALRRIRDRKTARLLAGKTDRALFHDVEAINRRLQEQARTIDLFKRIEKANERFASVIADSAEEALVEGREYKLARKYLGDPATRFDNAKRYFEAGLKESAGLRLTPELRDASARARAAIFAGEVARLVKILHHSGDRAGAKQLQAKGLKVVRHDAIRSAL